MSIEFISSDFDGTLTGRINTDGSDLNVRAFIESDLVRVINSGSNPKKLQHAINQVSDRSWNELTGPFIASGGALLLEPGKPKPIWEAPLGNINSLLSNISLSGIKLNDYIFLLCKNGWVRLNNRIESDTYYVISIRVQDEKSALEFKDKFYTPEITITLNRDIHGGGTRIQIASNDAGKDKVIEVLRDRFSLENPQLAHLGDDWNDLPAWLIPKLLSGVVETTGPKIVAQVPEPKVEILRPEEAGVAKFIQQLKTVKEP